MSMGLYSMHFKFECALLRVQTHERLYRKGPSSMEAYMSDCSYGKVRNVCASVCLCPLSLRLESQFLVVAEL